MVSYEKKYYAVADERSDYEKGNRGEALSYIRAHAKEGNVLLEVGCGTGNIARMLPEGVLYIGVDASSFAVEEGRRRYAGRENVSFTMGLAHVLPFASNRFDFVAAFFSLEHLPKPRESLDEMVRVLRPGGHLLILAPNLEFPLARPNAIRHKSLFYKIVFYLSRAADYILRLFGIYRFRTISGNFTEATGNYERIDDDLSYIVSTYEVLNYLKEKGLSLVRVARFAGRSLRKLITYLPGMEYYGTELNIIMKK